VKTRPRWYDPSPDLSWLLPLPDGDRPDRELPPDRIQLDLIEALDRDRATSPR
jgi:hypothetical protein